MLHTTENTGSDFSHSLKETKRVEMPADNTSLVSIAQATKDWTRINVKVNSYDLKQLCIQIFYLKLR